MSATYPMPGPWTGGRRGRRAAWRMMTERPKDGRGRETGRGPGPELGPEFGPGFGPPTGRGGGPGGRRGRHGGRPGWDGGARFGRGRKAARGDVRAAILVLLAEEPMHGYQMIRELAERSGGAWRPSPGSVYPTLAQLEDEGLIEADASDGKRIFTLTEAGRAHVAAVPEGTPPPWEAALETGTETRQLRDLLGQLAAAVIQVNEAGSDAQRVRTEELLTETRRAIYRILADDETPTT